MAQAIDQTDALIGRTLGEFVIEELIGEGGFGRVYRAEQPALQREAVIKVLRLEETASTGTERFLREARLASRLDHPFAAHIYAFGAEPDNLLWIAMELVRGTPLDRVLVEAPMPLPRAIPFLRRLCEVVQTAHDQDIVHRDLKPANVMVLSRAGNVFPKLLDLGIAKDVTSPDAGAVERPRPTSQLLATTGPGRMGTPHYMAPEQWVNPAGAGPPADIYALGVLTFEVLTGAPPFPGETVIDVAKMHARAAPPPLPDGFPPQLSDAIARAMAKRPEDRFPSALSFSEALIESSGIALDSVNVPMLDELTRDEVLVRAPQPIAETAAALDSARNPQQALAALWNATHACARYVGVVALACRSRVGSGRYDDSDAASTALLALRGADVDAETWWRLARELARPFQSIPDAHPMPELVAVFFDGGAELRTAMDELLKARASQPNASEARKFLAGAIPALAAVLRSLSFLSDYPLAVPHGGLLELWMGVRRPTRASARLSAGLEEGKPALLDASGNPVVSLWPMAQVAPPSPNQPAELFMLAGGHRLGALLTAPPVGFERRDEELFEKIDIAAEGDGRDKDESDGAHSPYLGLRTFTHEDAGSFFGREREVEAFVNRLKTTTLIAVVGPSGAGKSSFIRAGVLPALSGRWRSIVARPGRNPVAALLTALGDAGISLERAALETDADALGDALRASASEVGAVVVIDQFEELFTLCLDPVERDLFASSLVAAARSTDDRLRVLFTLRDDFLVRAVGVSALRERLTGNLQVLATPVAADMRRILVEPARRAGYTFEDDELPDEMVAEVADEPGGLALLSFTAYQLWQFRDRHFRKLGRKAYRALGGVGGALAQHAEATLADLDKDDDEGATETVREIFRHLITADGTRAVMSRAELLQVAGGDRSQPVLEALIGARLLTAMEGEGDEERIEVVHEALLSAWPRVVRWRQDDAQNARLRDQLRVAARQWVDRDRPKGLLWRGDALAELRIWRTRYGGSLTETEEAFSRASLEDAARGRRVRRIALATVILALSVALAIFVRLRGVAEDNRERAEGSAAALDSQLTASFEEQGRRALIDGDTTAGLLFLERAFFRGADSAALRFMIGRALEPLDAEVATLIGHESDVLYVGYAPDGSRLYTSSTDGTVRLWNADDLHQEHVLADHPRGRIQVAFSNDGTLLATGAEDALVRLWRASDGALAAAPLRGHEAPVQDLVFSPDDATLYTASGDGTIRAWSRESASELRSFRVAPPGADVAFDLSADGSRLAVGTFSYADLSGAVSVWSVDGRKLASLDGHEGGIWYVRFDREGKRVATASTDRTSRIFDAATGETISVLRGHDNRVTDVRWDPGGDSLATASADTIVKIWDPRSGATLAGMQSHTGQVNRLRYSSDGARLLSVAADGSGRLWLPRRGVLAAVFSHGGFLFDGAFRPDGRHVVTASQLGTAKVWRVDRAGLLATFAGSAPPGVPEPPVALAGAARLAHRGVDLVTLWDPSGDATRELAVPGAISAFSAAGESGRVAAASGTKLVAWTASGELFFESSAGSDDPLVTIALDGKGALLAAMTRAGELTIWDTADRRPVARSSLGAPVSGIPWQLSWAPSGEVLVAVSIGDNEKPSRLLRARNLEVIAELGPANTVSFDHSGEMMAALSEADILIRDRRGAVLARLEPSSPPTSAAWAPDGSKLFVGQSDGGLTVWQVSDWTTAGQIDAHDLFIPWVATSRDGALLVTVGFDAIVKIWSVESLRQLHALRVEQGTAWASFLPGGRLATSNGPNVDVWSATIYGGDASALVETLRCRLPFRLENLTVVPKVGFKPCSALNMDRL